jgi:hypothetical protein
MGVPRSVMRLKLALDFNPASAVVGRRPTLLVARRVIVTVAEPIEAERREGK